MTIYQASELPQYRRVTRHMRRAVAGLERFVASSWGGHAPTYVRAGALLVLVTAKRRADRACRRSQWQRARSLALPAGCRPAARGSKRRDPATPAGQLGSRKKAEKNAAQAAGRPATTAPPQCKL
ncbi:hypothetical protein GUJ93_ZPchr0001g29709 [Zizania palustris]|uniref:Uncharacterized protein n=1 Tax=Zizania palustris TaxID=103762 RepID=A0A8J5S555_ZIZPA|nr:hypothetical protein GUJ93_ZPchr0001g29709 [Zizania palustris]